MLVSAVLLSPNVAPDESAVVPAAGAVAPGFASGVVVGRATVASPPWRTFVTRLLLARASPSFVLRHGVARPASHSSSDPAP